MSILQVQLNIILEFTHEMESVIEKKGGGDSGNVCGKSCNLLLKPKVCLACDL